MELATNLKKYMMRKKTLLSSLFATLLAVLMLTGCSETQNISYFQDYGPGFSETVSQSKPITFQPGDKLSIIVTSRNPQLSSLFTLSQGVMLSSGTTSNSRTTSSNQYTVLYTIDSKGDIDFPVLGKIHVGGLSREQVASTIKEQLFKEDLVKDAVVSVEFGGIHFSVLGEVNKPGQYNFENDRETILDAISRAGDLTIYGQRDHVTVIRTEGGERKVYNINMLSGQDITSSPAYYLKQGDIIYVDPNPTRARQSTVNGNTFRSSAFWVSMASLAMSVTMLIKNW